MVVVVFVWVLSDALGSACAQRMLKVVDDPPGCVRCCAALWATDMGSACARRSWESWETLQSCHETLGAILSQLSFYCVLYAPLLRIDPPFCDLLGG